jgi:hypothetical protein
MMQTPVQHTSVDDDNTMNSNISIVVEDHYDLEDVFPTTENDLSLPDNPAVNFKDTCITVGCCD